MCGRYSLTLQGVKIVHELAEVRIEWPGPPRYNLAPGQCAPVIRWESSGPAVAMLRWGLIPGWATDPKIAFQCINARGETIATKPAFRSAFKKRRCLVPADGFYEWQKLPGRKQPWRFLRPDCQLFLFAGLWESWRSRDGSETLETFTIATTSPNSVASPVHDRMPVILTGQGAQVWLKPEATPEELSAVLRSVADDFLICYRVSPLVNNARNDIPECLNPLLVS